MAKKSKVYEVTIKAVDVYSNKKALLNLEQIEAVSWDQAVMKAAKYLKEEYGNYKHVTVYDNTNRDEDYVYWKAPFQVITYSTLS